MREGENNIGLETTQQARQPIGRRYERLTHKNRGPNNIQQANGGDGYAKTS